MKALEITADGRIQGLSVIGFHGEVDARYTPGRQGPIYMDTAGRLAQIERVELPSGRGSAESLGRAWLILGQRAEQGIAGVATRIGKPLPALLDSFFVVVGSMECEHAQVLLEVGPHVDDQPRVEAFLRWLVGQEFRSEKLQAERIGALGVWYCTLAEANALYRRIAHVAEKEMRRARDREDERALYQMSWWRSRVAMTDEDRYFAAVGMERSDRTMAEAYLKAVFRRKTREELEVGLEHARRQFDSLCGQERRQPYTRESNLMPKGRQQGVSPTTPTSPATKYLWRHEVREPHFVRPAA